MDDTSSGPALAIYTVPAGRAFLPALAGAILAGDLPRPGGRVPGPLDLADLRILLPTRRAARMLQRAFLEASGAKALLTPRIRPIAPEEDDLGLLQGLLANPYSDDGAGEVPAAIAEVDRRLVLAELVLRWARTLHGPSDPHPDAQLAAVGAATPAQAVRLARELARLMDAIEIEGASLARLPELVPASFAEHWQRTLEFLDIVLSWWPAYLDEHGLTSPMDRRNRMIAAEAQRLASAPPASPVIVAGVTGSIPATVELMRAVLASPGGAVVLPGLDFALDEETWALLAGHPEHPQHGLSRLLAQLGVDRRRVRVLAGAEPDGPARQRALVLSEALRPAPSTHRWAAFSRDCDRRAVREALAGVSLIEAPSATDEAEVISLVLREALERPGETAALVTPDRKLARRVVARLEGWGIRVDDSAGRPLRNTVPGTFLDLVVDSAGYGFAPARLMALLEHPLVRLGWPAAAMRRAARALDVAAFRTEYFGQGLDGVAAALERAAISVGAGRRRHRVVRRLWPEDWQAARDLVARLVVAFAPLTELFARPERHPLRTLVAAHLAVAEELARLPQQAEECHESPIWQGEDGEAVALIMTELLHPDLPAPLLAAGEYADFLRGLLDGESVRPTRPAHPRLSIWGPLEARLQQPDVLVLGSLNEGTWPAATDPGPWLNRPMREALALPQAEAEIGRAAHDFVQLLGGRRVVLTRAEKIDGAPTVPSRWLLRLEALLRGLDLPDALGCDLPWLGWARLRDRAGDRRPVRAPQPRPPVAVRPRQLGVSDVERWMANPYAIFAGRILELERLPELGAEPGAALRGTIVHEALGRFAKQFPERLPGDIRGELLAIARAVLVDYTGSPRVAAFWVPRFARFADWFAETEPRRRSGAGRVHAEVSGAMVLSAPAGTFTVTARADRIDEGPEGVFVTDYKTAAGEQIRQLAARAANGLAPQLPLEAAMLAAGTFTDLGARPAAGLRYISASGGEPPGLEIVLAGTPAELAARAEAGLLRLIAQFDQETTPYAAVRRSQYDYRYDDFAHLARVEEWQSGNGREEA